MIELKKAWLETAPWQAVVTVNQAVCQSNEANHLPNTNFDVARKLWEEAAGRTLTLDEALEICRRCHELKPFRAFNANTFAAVAKTLLQEPLKQLPPVEAQIVSSTVGHYIVGQISGREKDSVLKHFGSDGNPRRNGA